jgi:hypothetical protein
MSSGPIPDATDIESDAFGRDLDWDEDPDHFRDHLGKLVKPKPVEKRE